MNRPDSLGFGRATHLFIGLGRNGRTCSVVDKGSDRDLRSRGRWGAVEHTPSEAPLQHFCIKHTLWESLRGPRCRRSTRRPARPAPPARVSACYYASSSLAKPSKSTSGTSALASRPSGTWGFAWGLDVLLIAYVCLPKPEDSMKASRTQASGPDGIWWCGPTACETGS